MDFHYAVGERIPGTPYRVTQHIAAGGMGAVFEVMDTGVERRFALKTLRAELAGDAATEQRMLDEARTLGQLTNRNVVQVFTAGVTKDALRLPFIVMERLVGSTLRGLLRQRGALGLRTTAVIALELLGALADAHALGLVHRDIKPDNVFLHRYRKGERMTKLLDFGVAELVAKANEDPDRFFGTYKYASPEQPVSAPISKASDLYSVGLVVYEMLAGHHAFPHVKTLLGFADANVHEVPRIPESWPMAVRELVGSSLEKDPAKRPRDAWAFASRLRVIMRALEVDIETPLTEEMFLEQPGAVALAVEDTEARDPMNESRFAPVVDDGGDTVQNEGTMSAPPETLRMLPESDPE